MEYQNIFGLDEKGEFKNMRCLDIMLRIISHRSKEMSERVYDRWRKNRGGSVKTMLAEMDAEVAVYEKCAFIDDYNSRRTPTDKVQRLAFIEEEIMLSFLYPRMDYNVSTMQNHLLKLPFSVHPSSKKISIPLTKKQVLSFDPESCVTINTLLENIDYQNFAGTDDNMKIKTR